MANPEPDEDRAEAPGGASSLLLGREGCISSFLSSGCGCLAFLGGAAVAIAIFGAHLLSGWAERAIDAALSSELDATVQVEGVGLSWSQRQTIESVTLLDPDGREVAEARVEAPSLLDLLRSDRKDLAFDVRVLSMATRVNSEGVGDLERIAGVGGDTMFEVVLRRMARAMDPATAGASLAIHVDLDEWRVDDAAVGGSGVQVRGLRAEVSLGAGAASVRLVRAEVDWGDPRGAVQVSGEVALTRDLGIGPIELERLRVSSGGVPLDVARALGLVRRRAGADGPGLGPGVPAAVLSASLAAVNGELEAGALLDVDVERAPDGTSTMGAIRMSGPEVDVVLGVRWEGGRATGDPGAVGQPLRITVRPREGALSGALGGLFPARLRFEEQGAPPAWEVVGSSFSAPHRPLDLLGGEGPQVAALAGVRLKADVRQQGRLEVPVTISVAGNSAADEAASSDPAATGTAANRVGGNGLGTEVGAEIVAAHRLTSIDYDARSGGRASSYWRLGDAGGANLSVAQLEVPPVSMVGATPEPLILDLAAAGVPPELLGGDAGLPDELLALLPERIPRLRLTGYRLGPGSGVEVEPMGVDLRMGNGDRVAGTVTGGELLLPRVQLEVPSTAAALEVVVRRFVPWCVSVSPLSGEPLSVIASDYSVDLGAEAFEDSGKLRVRIPPVEVTLQALLVRSHFEVGPDPAVEWGPDEFTVNLDANVVRYQSVAIPLGERLDPIRVKGLFDRTQNTLSLEALAPTRALQGAENIESAVPVRITLTGAPQNLGLFVDRSYVGRQLQQLEALRSRQPAGGDR